MSSPSEAGPSTSKRARVDDSLPPPSPPQKSSRFWLADGNVILSVGSTLYKVSFQFVIYAQIEWRWKRERRDRSSKRSKLTFPFPFSFSSNFLSYVHKSILSRSSSIFSDMFLVGSDESSRLQGDQDEEIPTCRLLDNEAEWEVVLSFLYDTQ